MIQKFISIPTSAHLCLLHDLYYITIKLFRYIYVLLFHIGFSLRSLDLGPDSIMMISYPGELFMRILKLMILPLVISSLIAGSASLNARMNGRIALRTLVYFATTSFFNAFLGVCLVLLIHPGDPGMHNGGIITADRKTVNLLDSLLDLGR